MNENILNLQPGDRVRYSYTRSEPKTEGYEKVSTEIVRVGVFLRIIKSPAINKLAMVRFDGDKSNRWVDLEALELEES